MQTYYYVVFCAFHMASGRLSLAPPEFYMLANITSYVVRT